MVKSGRSVSLETSTWIKIENFMKDNNLNNISEAIEKLVEKALGEEDK